MISNISITLMQLLLLVAVIGIVIAQNNIQCNQNGGIPFNGFSLMNGATSSLTYTSMGLVIPYQKMTVFSQFATYYNVFYDFGSSPSNCAASPQGSPFSNLAYLIMLPIYSQLKVTVSFEFAVASLTYNAFRIRTTYMRTSTQSQIQQIQYVFSPSTSSTACTGTLFPTDPVSDNGYNYRAYSDTNHWCFDASPYISWPSCSSGVGNCVNYTTNVDIDLTSLPKLMLSNSASSSFNWSDVLGTVGFDQILCGAGEVSIKVKTIYLQLPGPGEFENGGYHFHYQQYSNIAINDQCCSIKKPANVWVLDASIFTCQCPYAGPRWLHLNLGYVLGNWNTQYHLSGLTGPMNISPYKILSSDYNITKDPIVTTGQSAVCSSVVLRTDYNSSSNSFIILDSTYTFVRIMVCDMYTANFYNNFLTNLNFTLNTIWSINSKQYKGVGNTSLHVFFATNQTATPSNDLIAFANAFFVQYPFFSASVYYIGKVQFGVWFISGNGKWTVNTSLFSLSNVTTAKSTIQIANTTFSNNPLVSQCYLGVYNLSLSQCIANDGLTLAMGYILAIPNINLLIRLSPFVAAIDELTYYEYHSTVYDRGFSFITAICWGWTNGKFILPIANEDYQSYMNWVNTRVTINRSRGLPPKRFAKKGEDIFFLNNTQDYWFSSLLLSVVVFMILKVIYSFIKRKKIAAALKPFSCMPFLFVNVIGDNIQYLSFRAFTQFEFIVLLQNKLATLNLISCYVTLFIVIFSSICLYPLTWKTSRKCFELDFLCQKFRSFMLMSILLFSKFLCGFIHAFLDFPALQIILLFGVNICVMISLLHSRKLFLYKRTFLILIIGCIIRILLFGALFSEIKIELLTQPPIVQLVFNQFNSVLMLIFQGLYAVEYFVLSLTNIYKWWVKPKRKNSQSHKGMAVSIQDTASKRKKKIIQGVLKKNGACSTKDVTSKSVYSRKLNWADSASDLATPQQTKFSIADTHESKTSRSLTIKSATIVSSHKKINTLIVSHKRKIVKGFRCRTTKMNSVQ